MRPGRGGWGVQGRTGMEVDQSVYKDKSRA